MPIKIPDGLPASEILKSENIFVMESTRAYHQDIRPLKIAILNLMPNKQETEVQLLRHLGNTPLQIDITLLRIESHVPKHTPMDYLENFYRVFSDISAESFDGMIITGAPIEQKPFEEVNYWPELCKIMDWAKTAVTSTLFICWGAQAALYHYYGINKYPLGQKLFGVFKHQKTIRDELTRGFDDYFMAPHSRHTGLKEDELREKGLVILATSEEAGVYMARSSDMSRVFVTGHCEYARDTLKIEYERDLSKGLAITVPENYFRNDNPSCGPMVSWRAHGSLMFQNWLNYYVYQITPYDLKHGVTPADNK